MFKRQEPAQETFRDTEKYYTIAGRQFYQTTLSPLQWMHMMLVIEAIAKKMSEKKVDTPDLSGATNLDITFMLSFLEVEMPDHLVRLCNIVLRDPQSRRPLYASPAAMMSWDDFERIDPATLVEVVADFFTFNDLSKVVSAIEKASLRALRLGVASIGRS